MKYLSNLCMHPVFDVSSLLFNFPFTKNASLFLSKVGRRKIICLLAQQELQPQFATCDKTVTDYKYIPHFLVQPANVQPFHL